MNKFRSISFIVSLILLPITLFSAGTVYLVLGSDTAIWDGMSTSRYHNTYNQSLYTDPLKNAYKVMDPAFRAPLVDSYGTPMKMTWWMMAGNIFRYATNKNFPNNNIMTMYLMKKYHGENVIANGDELTLHYHTFAWTDYDQDGLYHWNQALTFEECRDDWDVTLAQFLLEENVFPVSFRSGWHYMDNTWQAELDDWIPYSMHNAWPSRKLTDEEPYANVIDWSQAPNSWVPYHPSSENYQVPGDSPGWNLRSAHFNTALARGYMDSVFAKAAAGEDQVPCFWGHLPETDFADNMVALHEAAMNAAMKYPTVNFKYCTAIEAMQFWRGTPDRSAPEITITQAGSGESVYYRISSNDQLFQPKPFVAIKLRDGSYEVVESVETGSQTWETSVIPHYGELAKIGVAATDNAGNLTTELISIVGDDVFVDNEDEGYGEHMGTFRDNEDAAWGVRSRIASVSDAEPIWVTWSPHISQAGFHHIHYQVPQVISDACQLTFVVHSGTYKDTIRQTTPLPAKEWIYLGTHPLQAGNGNLVELYTEAQGLSELVEVPVEVMKFSPLVREKDFHASSASVDFGSIPRGMVSTQRVYLRNNGTRPLAIHSIQSQVGHTFFNRSAPLTLAPMQEVDLKLIVEPQELGVFADTIHITTDDPLHPSLHIGVSALVEPPFYLVDNDDVGAYFESGDWRTSVAQAWGSSSRYAFLGNGAWARFSIILPESGTYRVEEIVPSTVNSSDDALYIIKLDGVPIDSVYQDQNAGSGAWVTLGEYALPAGKTIDVEVHDTGNSTVTGVLRADAIIFRMQGPGLAVDNDLAILPKDPKLYQNFPNPFNPTTTIRYYLPADSRVQLRIFDVTGREVLAVEDQQIAGNHYLVWNGQDKWGNAVSTGVYLCQMQAEGHIQTIKMIYLR